jgi:hypothetical protein
MEFAAGVRGQLGVAPLSPLPISLLEIYQNRNQKEDQKS